MECEGATPPSGPMVKTLMLPFTLLRYTRRLSDETTRPVKLACPLRSGSRKLADAVCGCGSACFSLGSATRCRISPVTGSSTSNSLVLPETSSERPSWVSVSA